MKNQKYTKLKHYIFGRQFFTSKNVSKYYDFCLTLAGSKKKQAEKKSRKKYRQTIADDLQYNFVIAGKQYLVHKKNQNPPLLIVTFWPNFATPVQIGIASGDISKCYV